MNRPQMTVIKSKTLAMGQSAKFLTRACGFYLLCLIAIYYYTLIYNFLPGGCRGSILASSRQNCLFLSAYFTV